MLLSDQKMCLLLPRDIPEIAWYSGYDSEINLPIFSRICPSGLNGPYLGASGRSGIGVVHCIDGMYLNNSTDYTFHVRSYHDLN